MKRIITTLILLIAIAPTWAETAQAKIDALNNKALYPNILQANYEVTPKTVHPLFGELYVATVGWYYTENAVAKHGSGILIIVSLGTQNEAAYWLGSAPTILTPEVKYLSGRTASGWGAQTGAQQLAAISTKLNEYWVNAQGAARDPILNLTITPTNANTILASGVFDTGSAWEQRQYYVTLVDPNGSLTAGNANVKFRRVAEVPAP